ncbi:MAG: LexA family protein [Candidatus Levyibacteriota bacterium]
MNTDDAAKKLRKFYLQEKRMPSFKEFADILSMTKMGAYKLAQRLIDANVIGKDEKGKLFPKSLFDIPILGSIKAGYPAAADTSDESLNVFEFIHDATGDVMFLKVSGDSMKDAAIVEGDYVVVDRSKTPKLGDIVCALIDGEWTLKYYDIIEGKTALVPANDNYPIIYPVNELMVGGNYGGVVTLILRKPHP